MEQFMYTQTKKKIRKKKYCVFNPIHRTLGKGNFLFRFFPFLEVITKKKKQTNCMIICYLISLLILYKDFIKNSLENSISSSFILIGGSLFG